MSNRWPGSARAASLGPVMDELSQAVPDPLARRRLERYLELLYRASAGRNLTRIPRELAWTRHIEESLSLVPLRRWRPGELVVDLGTGGGIPGIPLATVLQGLRFVLVERSETKAALLRAMLAELGLPGVTVVAREGLELGRDPARPRADVLISRAAAPLPRLLPLAGPLLRPGGEALLLVGESASVSPQLAEICRRARLGSPEIVVSGSVRVLRVRLSEPPAVPPSKRPRPPGQGPRQRRPHGRSPTG